MKKIVVEKIKNHLADEDWAIKKIKKLDFWAFHDSAPPFCVVQAGCSLIFFHDIPLNETWKKGKYKFFEMLNGLNYSFSHGVRGIKISDGEESLLHISAVWHNYYNENEFGKFLDHFTESVLDLYYNKDVIIHLKK